MRWYFIFHESLQSAYRTVILNKLRTLLSLLGVTIGIFSIVSVFSVVDSMKANMKETLDSFGTNVVVVEKWPWAPEDGAEFAWWEYLNRPVVTRREHEQLKDRMKSIQSACFISVISSDIEYLDNKAENIQVWGTSGEFEEIRSFNLASADFLQLLKLIPGKVFALSGKLLLNYCLKGKIRLVKKSGSTTRKLP